jgi:hypothetical protein
MIYKQFIKQNYCERVLFYKLLTSSSFKACHFENASENPILLCKGFTLQKTLYFKPSSKQVSKPFDLNSCSKTPCFTNTRVFAKDFGFPNLPQGTNLNLRYNMMVTLLLSNLARGKVTVSVGSQVT